MNIIVFDLETKLRPGQDCPWEDKRAMGISVGVSFSYATGEFRVHMDDNMPDLWEDLARADLVAGYNIAEFDLPLIHAQILNITNAGMAGGSDPVLRLIEEQYRQIQSRTYDIYLEAKAGCGAGKFQPGFKCDQVLRATWGHSAAKTGNGAGAPDLYKAGRLGELISYCVADVQRERRLFERCWTHGTLRAMGHREGAEYFGVRSPREVLRLDTPWENFNDPLPFRLDGDPGPTPPPSEPYVPVARPSLASDDI